MRALLVGAALLAGCSSGQDVAVPTPTPDAVTVVLADDGLVVGGRALPFRSASTEVIAALVEPLGPGRTTAVADCGEGPRTTYAASGLTLVLEGNAFVGWRETGPRATTDAIATGTTLTALRAARPGVEISEESQVAEWRDPATGLGGVLAGRDPGSAVTSLHAGETCVAP